MSDPVPSHAEIERQYRILRLEIDAHGFLKDGCNRLARGFEVILLACSIVFCATTFAQDGLYQWLGFTADSARYVLGLASIVALVVSTVLLIVDFKGRAALHSAAVERWSRALVEFRRVQPDQGSEWPSQVRAHLHEVYWSADRESVKIPNNRFLALKSRHLRKCEISKLKSRYPGCPRFLVSLCWRARDTCEFLAEFRRGRPSSVPPAEPRREGGPGIP